MSGLARCTRPLLALYMVLVGALMISRFPTPSFKAIKFNAEHVRYVIIGFVALIAAVISYPWETMVVICLGYILILVAGLWQGRKMAAANRQALTNRLLPPAAKTF